MPISKDIPFAYRRDIPFDFELNERGDLKMLEDVDALNQAIYAILISNSGDKPMEPLFGSNIEDLVFDPGYPLNVMEFEIKERLKTSMELLEPGVVVLNIHIDFSKLDDHAINVKIFYALNDGITTGVFDESLSIEDIRR